MPMLGKSNLGGKSNTTMCYMGTGNANILVVGHIIPSHKITLGTWGNGRFGVGTSNALGTAHIFRVKM